MTLITPEPESRPWFMAMRTAVAETACGFAAFAATGLKVPAPGFPALTFFTAAAASLALNALVLLAAADMSDALSTPSLASPTGSWAWAKVLCIP